MKSILRSPIEPEFTYFLKTTFRKKKEGLESRFRSDVARLSRTLTDQKKNFQATLEKAFQKVKDWRKEYQTEYLAPNLKKGADVADKLQSESTHLADTAVDAIPSWESLQNKLRNIHWSSFSDRRAVLIGIFILAILVGMGVKTIARDTVTIGFEDYKLSDAGSLVDLNAVQKRVLSGETASMTGNVFAGEQCTE